MKSMSTPEISSDGVEYHVLSRRYCPLTEIKMSLLYYICNVAVVF
jgi:hypothetical protein